MDTNENQGRFIKIIVLNTLREEIYKTFKKDSQKIYSLIEKLKENPKKGKVLGHVANISIRELKYKNFRLYFILDGHKLYLFEQQKISELLIRFIKLSTKNNQQQTIEEIRFLLEQLGEKHFK